QEGRLPVDSAFNRRDFTRLDTIFNQWCSGADRFVDGTWKLATYEEALHTHFSAWRKWDAHLSDIKRWQQSFPDSFAAKYAEAIYWQAYAWHARGGPYVRSVSKESQE